MRFRVLAYACLGVALVTSACSRDTKATDPVKGNMSGPLVAASTSMATAWEIPKSPASDPKITGSPVPEDVKLGFRIFMDTPSEAPRFTRNHLTCNNCHLNGGQRERAMPLVGLAGMFPEFNKRSGRSYALADRVVDCFLRSENGTAALAEGGPDLLPTPASKEVLAVVAYLTWLSDGYQIGKNPPWRGKNTIAADKLLPVASLDRAKGEALYNERCVTCHGADGQGVQIGDKKAGPLWGPDSWNDGAGAARVYTLAGMIRYAMPYLDPGSLTDEQAQQIAAFVNSKERPRFPFKERDYQVTPRPPDAVYYTAPVSQSR